MPFESFDVIFQQPDICVDLDGPAVGTTRYAASATRAGDVWTADVHGLPGELSVRAEGRTWREVEEELVTRVPQVLGAAPGTVVVSLEPADRDAAGAIRALTGARVDRALAEQAERDAARAAVRTLTARGWSTEDAGIALRLPPARVAQIATPDPAERP